MALGVTRIVWEVVGPLTAFKRANSLPIVRFCSVSSAATCSNTAIGSNVLVTCAGSVLLVCSLVTERLVDEGLKVVVDIELKLLPTCVLFGLLSVVVSA